MAISKTRSKNFSIQENNTLVDQILENKAKLFGALSSSLTFDEKSAIWESIATTISREHGNIRSKDDVFKKWSNILVKNKPIISDKLASARKTGGGPAEAELTEFELKIKVIKGVETFEGISSGIDLSLESNCLSSDVDLMITSPTAASIPSQSCSESGLDMNPPRKRRFTEELNIDSVKESILQNEVAKLGVLNSIHSKIEDLAVNIDSKMDRIGDNLELMVSNQNKLICLMSNIYSGMHHTPPPLQQSSHLQQGYHQKPYFPPLHPFHPQQDKD